jgi:tetratricopeptide (TPR) repeat protein
MAEVTFRDYLTEIDGLIERGMIDQAIQHCQHILTQYPKAVEVYRMLGKALLEQEEDRAAQDVFQRVLSADPEDFVARVGLSIIHDRNNELELAIWHMERAFEIAPSNSLIQGELRRLYARRDGEPPDRIPLTRGALARMYAAGDLNSEAIANLRQLLAEQSDRIDLEVQLAEVLWRDEQRVEAAEHTQQITTALPYCLKANLILGAILRANGANGESDDPLLRAQAVDPENEYAQRLFSGMGPLYKQSIMVDHLELQTMEQMLEAPLPLAETEEVPDWLRGLSDVEQPLLEEPDSVRAARLPAGLHMPDVATEVPDWLQGLTGETGAAAEAEVPAWLAALTGAAAVEALTDRERESEEVVVRPADEAVPDWITQLGQTGKLAPAEELPPEEEEPAWMAQLQETPPAPYSDQVPVEADTEIPDWLAQLQASQPALEAKTVTEQEPEWLSQLRVSGGEAETKEEPGADLGIGAAAAALAGAAIFAAHEAGEEEAEPIAEVEPPIDLVQPEEPLMAAEAVLPLSFDVAAEAVELEGGVPELMEVETAEVMSMPPEEAEAGLVVAAAAGAVLTGEEEPPAPPESMVAVSEEMPSADDALAFLAKLAEGKEDELRAQAERDADLRMAEIMGRKPAEPTPLAEEQPPPIKMTVPAATVAAVAAGLAALKTAPEEETIEPEAQVAAMPSEVPEEMPSADEALAYLSRLAEGKEDQLRAQAEEEAEARMAEIMGRKPGEPAVSEEPPAAGLAAVALGAAAIAAVGTTEKEEAPVEVPEEMPSADDALAFLAKLAEGKEDELRAQAEQEAEARMAAIMGRSAPLEPAEPIEAPAVAVIEAQPEAGLVEWPEMEESVEVAEPAIEAELPDWLKAMRPAEETAAETPESELPEWLRAMRPADEDPDVGLVALMEEEEAEIEVESPSVAELPEWPRAQQPIEAAFEDVATEPRKTTPSFAEAAVALGALSALSGGPPEKIEAEPSASDVAALTPAAVQAEEASTVQPSALPQTSALLPLDWWVQTAADTAEEPLAELPQPYLSPRARAIERERVALAAGVESAEQPQERRLPQTGPLRQTGPLSLPQTGPLGTPQPAAMSSELEMLVSRVYQDERDYAARLDLARTYWATGNREGAYAEYQVLVDAGEYTKETMTDLETIVEIHDQTDWHRMLGDVYMKAGRLSSALEHYRHALSEV